MTWENVPNIEFKRYGHSADLFGCKIYLFAGFDILYYYVCSNDLLAFDLNTMELSEIRCKGYIPPIRYGHGSALVNANLFVYGGYNNDDYLNDFYSLNMNNYNWIKIND